MEEREKKKKKPDIDYDTLFDGNVIRAVVNGTHFISWRTQIESRKKGKLGVSVSSLGGEGEGEIERKDEWMGVVWEPETGLMPLPVWDEKRRKEIIENIKDTISVATGSSKENITVTSVSGLVSFEKGSASLPASFTISSRCINCGAEIHSKSIFCPYCGKHQ